MVLGGRRCIFLALGVGSLVGGRLSCRGGCWPLGCLCCRGGGTASSRFVVCCECGRFNSGFWSGLSREDGGSGCRVDWCEDVDWCKVNAEGSRCDL